MLEFVLTKDLTLESFHVDNTVRKFMLSYPF